MLESLRNTKYVEELADIYKTIISILILGVLLELKEEIEMLDKKLEKLGEKEF
ncbi:MAG: hypothetical protein KIIPBIDF_01165 [Candidatus Methanoperedenaceae archaeon GB50]|nr:MAG: hypothetical protein KIIPBIDF_01165 [Candidatus Methanoperedenaceae archaeon GB50]